MEDKSHSPLKSLASDYRLTVGNKGGLINRILLIGIAVISAYLLFFTVPADTFSGFTPRRALIDFLLWRYTPDVLAVLLLVCALYLIQRYYFNIFVPLKREIERVSSVLSKRGDPETFTQDFAIIDETFREARSLRDGWREFKETLHQTPHDISGNEIYHNTKRPQDYFHERGFSQSGREIRQLEFYPGIFVAVGLVLTFIGLVVALQAAGDAIITTADMPKAADTLEDETKQVTAALKDLIAASAFKFMTSISGIGCSILLTWVSRHFVNKLSERILRLQNQLERGLIHLSAEKIQLRVERETGILAQGIREGFSEAITEMSGNELRLFADRMDTIGEELQKAEKVVDQLGDTYQTQLKKIITAFISTTQETADQAKVFQAEISKNQKTFSEDLSRQYEEQFGRMTAVFSENFDDAQQKLSDFQAAVQTELEASGSVLSKTSEDIIETSKEQLSAHASEMGVSVQSIFREAGEEVSRLKELMDDNYEASISGLRRSNEEFLDASKTQLEEHSAEVGESYKRLGADIAQSVKSASEDFNNDVATRFEALSGVTGKLISTTEKALLDHNGLQAKSSAIVESISGVSDNLRAMKDEVIAVSEKNFSGLTHASEKLDAVSGGMQEFSRTLRTKTDSDFDQLATTISGLESSLKDLLSQTKSFTENSRTLGTDLETAVRGFSEQNLQTQGELIQAMGRLSEALADSTAKITEAQSARSIWGFKSKR